MNDMVVALVLLRLLMPVRCDLCSMQGRVGRKDTACWYFETLVRPRLLLGRYEIFRTLDVSLPLEF